MVAESKASVAARFAAFTFPSAADFGNLIDSYTDYGGPATTLNLALAAHSGGGGRIISYSTSVAATVWSAATAGMYLLGAATTAAAVSRLGAGTVGGTIFAATTGAIAQVAMSGGTVGRQLFEAATTAEATNVLSVMATASQAQMEAASTGAVAVTPDVLKHHPAVPKAWVNFNGIATTSVRSSHNVSSVLRNGTGDYSIVFTTPFSNAGYCYVGHSDQSGANSNAPRNINQTDISAGGIRLLLTDSGPTANDCEIVNLVFFGDQ